MDYLDQVQLDIVISQEKAEEFIKANLPGHKIFHVEGDGLCTLRSFLGIRSALEIDVKLDEFISKVKSGVHPKLKACFNCVLMTSSTIKTCLTVPCESRVIL